MSSLKFFSLSVRRGWLRGTRELEFRIIPKIAPKTLHFVLSAPKKAQKIKLSLIIWPYLSAHKFFMLCAGHKSHSETHFPISQYQNRILFNKLRAWREQKYNNTVWFSTFSRALCVQFEIIGFVDMVIKFCSLSELQVPQPGPIGLLLSRTSCIYISDDAGGGGFCVRNEMEEIQYPTIQICSLNVAKAGFCVSFLLVHSFISLEITSATFSILNVGILLHKIQKIN